MEDPNQDKQLPRVVLIDDRSDIGMLTVNPVTLSRQSLGAASGDVQSECMPDGPCSTLTLEAETSLDMMAVTISSQVKAGHFESDMVCVHDGKEQSVSEGSSDKSTLSECLVVGGGSGLTNVGIVTDVGDQQLSAVTMVGDQQLSAVTMVGDQQQSAVTMVGDQQLSAVTMVGDQQLSAVTMVGDQQPSTVTNVGDQQLSAVTNDGDLQPSAVTNAGDQQPSAVTRDGDLQLSTVTNAGDQQPSAVTRDGDLQPSAVTNTGDQQPSAVTSDGDLQLLAGASDGDLQMSTVTNVGDQQPLVVTTFDDQQHESTGLTIKCQTSNATGISDHAILESSAVCSNTGKENVRSYAGKETQQMLELEMNSDCKLVKNNLGVRTTEGSPECKPVNCNANVESGSSTLDNTSVINNVDNKTVIIDVDNETIISDVCNVELAIPAVSEKHETPSDVTDPLMKSVATDIASSKCDTELISRTQVPRYIIIRDRNTPVKQEVIRKPGDRLTSLLQRLTAGKCGKIAVKVSNVPKLTSPTAEVQGEVSESMSSVSPSEPLRSVQLTPLAFKHREGIENSGQSSVLSYPAPQNQLSQDVLTPNLSSQEHVSLAKMSSQEVVPAPKLSSQTPLLTFKLPSREPLSTPRMSLQDPIVTLKLSSQNHSLAKTHENQMSSQVEGCKTSSKKKSVPLKMIPGKGFVRFLPQTSTQTASPAGMSAQPAGIPLGQNKQPEASRQFSGQMFRVFGTVDGIKQSANSSEAFSASQNLPVHVPADKIKYVLNYMPVQGAKPSNIVFAGPDGKNIIFGKMEESYQKTSAVQKTSKKSKQFSLLQNSLLKAPESVQINTSSGIMKPVTVRSLLASSSMTTSALKVAEGSVLEAASANISTLSSPTFTLLQDTVTLPSVKQSTKQNKQSSKKEYQITQTGQFIIQPISPSIALTTTSSSMTGSDTLPSDSVSLSKLAQKSSAGKVSIVKSNIASSSLLNPSSKARTSTVFVMPTAVLSSAVPMVACPNVSSQNCVPAGIVTFSNGTATLNQPVTGKIDAVSKPSRVSRAIQCSANATQTFSNLIASIALQSMSGTTASSRSAPDTNPSQQSLNLALLQHLRQEIPQLGETTGPVRIIVSQGTGFKPAAKPLSARSQTAIVTKCTTETTLASSATTAVSRTEPKAATVTDATGKQIPKLIYPKPVNAPALIVLPTKSKSVSLLSMPFVAKNPASAVELTGGAAVPNIAASSHMVTQCELKNIKPQGSQAVDAAGVKGKSITDTPQNSHMKKVKVSASAADASALKVKNAVFAATVRTGQGPVSVRVVAPDVDDDSLDTMSDVGFSNIFPESSVPARESTRVKTTHVDSEPDQLFGQDIAQHACSGKLNVPHQDDDDDDQHEVVIVDDVASNIEMLETENSQEHETSGYSARHTSEDETDSETEVANMEEQDMSVLRQLLTNADSQRQIELESIPNNQLPAVSSNFEDLMKTKSQPGNISSADNECVTSSINTENSPLDQSITELSADGKDCDLKIESIFSLRDIEDFDDIELSTEDPVDVDQSEDPTELLPTFNVRTSDDWKSFLNPCFVVLERLSKGDVLARGSAKTTSKCSGYCRKRTLDYLCNLKLLRCINHPDPFSFLKLKQRRTAARKTLRKIIKHEVVNERCGTEDKDDVPMMGNIYKHNVMNRANPLVIATGPNGELFTLSPMLKQSGVKGKGGVSFPLVKEIYFKEAMNISLPVVKEDCVKDTANTSSSSSTVLEESCVRAEHGISLSQVSKTHARKSMSNLIPMVKVISVKKPVSRCSSLSARTGVFVKQQERSPVLTEAVVKKDGDVSFSLVRKTCAETAVSKPPSISKVNFVKEPLLTKETCLKEATSEVDPVVKQADVRDSTNILPEMVRKPCVIDTVKKLSAGFKQNCESEETLTLPVEHSPLMTDLKEDLSRPSPEKPIASEAKRMSVVSSGGPVQIDVSQGQNDHKSSDKTSTDLDSVSSSPDLQNFHTNLTELQNQVSRKRAVMFIEKLHRKREGELQVTQNACTSMSQPVRLTVTDNMLWQSPTKKQLKKKQSPRDLKHTTSKDTDALKHNAGGNTTKKLPAISVTTADVGISHEAASENVLPRSKELVSDSRSAHVPNIQNQSIKKFDVQNQNLTKPDVQNQDNKTPDVKSQSTKAKGSFVRLQPKVPVIPQEKIQAALQSLNSYLTATGRKPTEGNTQYILLKVDDQHVLVKWPATSVATPQQSGMTVTDTSAVPVSCPPDMSQRSLSAAGGSQKQHEVIVVTTEADSSCRASSDPVSVTAGISTKVLTSTSSAVTGIITPAPGAAAVTSVLVKSSSSTERREFKIIRPKAFVKKRGRPRKSPNSGCEPVAMADLKHASQKHCEFTSDNSAAVCLDGVTKSSLDIGPNLNPKTLISLLKSGVSTPVTSITSCPVSPDSSRKTESQDTNRSWETGFKDMDSSRKTSCKDANSSRETGSRDTNSSTKTGSKDTNITLSRLPPNSLLLPGRRKSNCVLSKEERLAKRRKLEEKYPLPPGIVIKCELDDTGYEQDPMWSGMCSTLSDNTSLIHRDSSEPFIMSSDDQVWSVENSVNISPYSADTGQSTEDCGRGTGLFGLPTVSNGSSLSPESYMNAEESSDEQDEPPALLDETTDDADDILQMETNADAQEDVPPVLQPMFTSSSTSLVEDTDVHVLDNTEQIPERSPIMPYAINRPSGEDPGPSAGSISSTSLYSDGSIDSGVDTNFPSSSFSYTSVWGTTGRPAPDRPISKNLKIQYLKELLKKKEMEIENMKRLQSESVPMDFDI